MRRKRKMADLDYNHIFFPQLLYNAKLGNNYTIGGSIVKVNKEIKSQKLSNLALSIVDIEGIVIVL